MFLIAQILGPKGIKGHVKVHSFTEDPFFLTQCSEVRTDEGEILKFVRIGLAKPPNIVELQCDRIDSRTSAEQWRNVKLYVPVTSLPPLEQEEYYWQELRGYAVKYHEEVLGAVIGIDNFGTSTDVIEILCSNTKKNSSVYIPFHRNFVQNIDRERALIECTLEAAEWIKQECDNN